MRENISRSSVSRPFQKEARKFRSNDTTVPYSLGGFGQLQAEFAGFGAHRGDQAGQVQHLNALVAEQALEVEVLYVQRAADFTGAVVGHARAALTVAAVGDIELMAIAPGASLLNLSALVFDMAAAEVILDEARDGRILYKGGQHLGLEAQRGRYAQYVRLSAGGLHGKQARYMHGLTVLRGDAHAHRRGYDQRIFSVLLKLHLVIPPMRRPTSGSSPILPYSNIILPFFDH